MKPRLCTGSDRVWALRYMREARVDLSLAQELNNPETVMELAIIAMKKAQLAVQHSLCQSEPPEIFEHEGIERELDLKESPARILIKMREVTQSLSEQEHPPKKETVVEATRIIVRTAESIVESLL